MTNTPIVAATVALCLAAGTAQAQRSAPPAINYDQHWTREERHRRRGHSRTHSRMTNRQPKTGESSSLHSTATAAMGVARWDPKDRVWPTAAGNTAEPMARSTLDFLRTARGMPAWGGTLPPDAIWQLVSYLQSQQPKRDTLSTTSW